MSENRATAGEAVQYPIDDRVSSFIDGRRQDPSRPGFRMPVINPATERPVSELREDDAEDVGRAVAAARQAFDGGRWSKLGFLERKKIIRRALDHVLAHADELAFIDCVDTGVPLWDIRGRKMQRVADNFEFFLEVASTAAGESYQQDERYLTVVTREPVGVAAIIAPWNSPLSLASMQIAPCIVFGNTCVVKPSEHTPLSLLRFVELLHEGGLPPGVVNLVNGRGPITGAELVKSKGVDLVKFVGGTETGKLIMANAAQGLKEVGLELGGKSAMIVFEEADPEKALDGALLGIYSNNGQQCLAGSRILVQRSIADDFMRRFVERARRIRVGDPLHPDTEMGPLAFKAHYERVLSYVDIATSQGAELLTGGRRPEGLDTGYYISPTAVLAPANDLRVCQEEIFGPFAAFLTFETVDEAIEIANASDFGLVSYIWSESLHTVMQASRGIRAGTIWVNTPLVREIRAPFGGFKHSGIGRDGRSASLDFYTESKTTTIPIEGLSLRKLGQG